jgi:hypothetical protein
MKSINSLITAATFIGAVSAASPALAVDEYNVSPGTTRTGERVALRGNDTGTLAKAKKNWPGMHHVAVSEVNSR